MKLLAIETSCDETALAALDCSYSHKNTENPLENVPEKGALGQQSLKGLDFSCTVLSHFVHSQVALHAEYGGVFPMMAKREHTKNILPLLQQLITETAQKIQGNNSEHETDESKKLHQMADELLINTRYNEIKEDLKNISIKDPDLFKTFQIAIDCNISSLINPGFDAITVTVGPGLEPALWVGITLSKMLSLLWEIPLLPANHMEGHVVSVLFNKSENFKTLPTTSTESIVFPAVSLLISGGHTELALMKNWNDYSLLGQTKDDAVGEAFDKVARMLNLPYPGGPEISKHAKQAREEKLTNEYDILFPRPMIHSKDFDFSFSGIKTAVLYKIRDIKKSLNLEETGELPPHIISAIALEFENAVTEVLIKKTFDAVIKSGVTTLTIGGGVIANTHIRAQFELEAEKNGITLLIPPQPLTTDNAIMIGMAGYISYVSGYELKNNSIDKNSTELGEDPFKASGNLVIGS